MPVACVHILEMREREREDSLPKATQLGSGFAGTGTQAGSLLSLAAWSIQGKGRIDWHQHAQQADMPSWGKECLTVGGGMP